MKQGTAIEVTPDIPVASRYRAKVKVIDRVLDAASGTFWVGPEFSNSARKTPAVTRCRASFPVIDVTSVGKGRDPAVGHCGQVQGSTFQSKYESELSGKLVRSGG